MINLRQNYDYFTKPCISLFVLSSLVNTSPSFLDFLPVDIQGSRAQHTSGLLTSIPPHILSRHFLLNAAVEIFHCTLAAFCLKSQTWSLCLCEECYTRCAISLFVFAHFILVSGKFLLLMDKLVAHLCSNVCNIRCKRSHEAITTPEEERPCVVLSLFFQSGQYFGPFRLTI